MKNSLKRSTLLTALVAGLSLFSSGGYAASEQKKSSKQNMRDAMKNVLIDNLLFMKNPKYDEEFFAQQEEGQTPRMTVISCADSRAHTTNFDFHPLGDVFFIRNIGNQIETCLGSIDYGVLKLNTPILMFLGHSKCGAITAVTDGRKLPKSIRDELKPIDVTHKDPQPTDEQIKENIDENVHDQVAKALVRYKDLIDEEKLWVIGGVYDFTLEGLGKLSIINVNGATDDASLKAFLQDAIEHGDYCTDPGRPGKCTLPKDS